MLCVPLSNTHSRCFLGRSCAVGVFAAGKGRIAVLTAILLGLCPAIRAQTASTPPNSLTHASEIRALTAQQAAQGYPAKIRGVVTGDVPAPDFFVQDATAGIYVEGSHSPVFPHHLGDLVEVEGITGPGRFAPVLREKTYRVVGKGTLPAAKLYTFSQLSDGQMDSQWVQVRGIIRSAAIDRTSWHETALALRVASGNGAFTARVPIEKEEDFSSWIDREVLIEGVCGSFFNSRRQLSGILFYVPRLSFIKMEGSVKETSISSLLQFSPRQGGSHRVRVRGVVVYQQPGSSLFLQAEGRGIRVLTNQDTAVQPGDVVTVFGFPEMGESAPILADAVFSLVSHGPPPTPLTFAPGAPWEEYDGALVTTGAILLDRKPQNGGLRLLLRTGDYLFEAHAPDPKTAERLRNIPLNSKIRVAGVCLVRSGGLWSAPESFRILIRFADDVAVLQAPSWWNFRHAMWLLAITGGVLLILVAWTAVLGRRLREQMAILRQRLRSGAVLEERNRIARELHDTLEQELAGITMQLDLASDCFDQVPSVARDAVETARRMSRHSMLEARRSVWDLRCHLLESGDLISALKETLKPLTPQDRVTINVETSGTPLRLPSRVEMNLLRIAQEAVANALKHAQCKHIDVSLHYAGVRVCLSVQDDGCGFLGSEPAGHFGLLDIRERAESVGGQLEIRSEPGIGTKILVEVPIVETNVRNEEPKAHTHSGR